MGKRSQIEWGVPIDRIGGAPGDKNVETWPELFRQKSTAAIERAREMLPAHRVVSDECEVQTRRAGDQVCRRVVWVETDL